MTKEAHNESLQRVMRHVKNIYKIASEDRRRTYREYRGIDYGDTEKGTTKSRLFTEYLGYKTECRRLVIVASRIKEEML